LRGPVFLLDSNKVDSTPSNSIRYEGEAYPAQYNICDAPIGLSGLMISSLPKTTTVRHARTHAKDGMNSGAIRSLVCGTRLLKGLEPPVCDELMESGRPVSAKAGAYLLNQGESSNTCYVLLRGKIRLLLHTPDGKRVIIDIIGPGHHLGFFVALTNKDYPISAEVIEPSELFAWNADTIQRVVYESPKLISTIFSALADRIMCLQSKVQQLATERIEQRLAHSLLTLAKNLGKQEQEGVLINTPLTHRDLAEMSGTNIYSVSRILGRWEQDDIILTGRRRIVLCRPEQLQELSSRQN